MALTLDVRLDGFDEPIGRLESNANKAVTFTYADDYAHRPDALNLSLSLPVGQGPFGDAASRPFFDNLLQERGQARADIVDRHGLDSDDIAGILFHLGRDCTGAVSILPAGDPPIKVPGDLERDYRAYEQEELDAIVRHMHEYRRLPKNTKDPSPLAGVQSKIAVARLPDGRLAEPNRIGGPTTHILKVPNRYQPRDAGIEHEGMRLSERLGFETAPTEVMEIGGIATLLVTRFDRRADENGHIRRRHQEDFCQALGLPPSLKYQRDGRPGRQFSTSAVRPLLESTIDPAFEREKFIDITLFDILIGNVDGHGKNFSLFHLPGNRLLTTPRYDVMPTMIDRQTTDQFAYDIGSAEDLEHLTPEAFDAFLFDLGIKSAGARRRQAQRMEALAQRLDAELDRIEDKNFGDLIATRIRTAGHVFGFPTPANAARRDTFVR